MDENYSSLREQPDLNPQTVNKGCINSLPLKQVREEMNVVDVNTKTFHSIKVNGDAKVLSLIKVSRFHCTLMICYRVSEIMPT